MINDWTKSEICMLYREAKDKRLQIQILAELTGLRTFEIENILREGGYIEMDDKKKEEILKEYYNHGLSDSAIAKKVGMAQSPVSKFLRSKGLPPNGTYNQKKDEIKEEVKMSEEKVSTPEIKNMVIPEEAKPAFMDKKMNIPGDGREDEVPTVRAQISDSKADRGVIESLKKETKENSNELKAVLPQSIPDPESLPINYDVIETLTPQQYYELAKMTIQSINSMIETLRTVWEG